MQFDALYAELSRLKDTEKQDIRADVLKELNTSDSLYDYITEIDTADKIKYAAAAATVVFFISKLKINLSLVFGVAVALLMVYYWNERQHKTSDTLNKDLLFKLRTLDALTKAKHPYLYLEPALINFFAYHVDLRAYSTTAFDRSLRYCDEILKLKYEIGLGTPNCAADVEVVEQLRVTCMNAFAELLFSVDGNQLLQKKVDAGVAVLAKLLLSQTAEIQTLCTQKHKKKLNTFTTQAPFAAPDDDMSYYELY